MTIRLSYKLRWRESRAVLNRWDIRTPGIEHSAFLQSLSWKDYKYKKVKWKYRKKYLFVQASGLVQRRDKHQPWKHQGGLCFPRTAVSLSLQYLWMPDVIIHDLVTFSKPEILNEVAALEIFPEGLIYYKIRWVLLPIWPSHHGYCWVILIWFILTFFGSKLKKV